VLVGHPAVSEAAAVGVPDEITGERLVCVCVLTPGATPGLELERELIEWVKQAMGSALKPSAIKFVEALPKTRNGKVMRRVIRAIYVGEDPGDLSALEHPQALDQLRL
jgi:acetyl-CoA synthetase